MACSITALACIAVNSNHPPLSGTFALSLVPQRTTGRKNTNFLAVLEVTWPSFSQLEEERVLIGVVKPLIAILF